MQFVSFEVCQTSSAATRVTIEFPDTWVQVSFIKGGIRRDETPTDGEESRFDGDHNVAAQAFVLALMKGEVDPFDLLLHLAGLRGETAAKAAVAPISVEDLEPACPYPYGPLYDAYIGGVRRGLITRP